MQVQSIQISGPDASTFLQGQITCDITTLNQHTLMAACCNQKGRMVANFWISQSAEDFYLTLPSSMVPILLDHLKKYVIFSKVTMKATDKVAIEIKANFIPIWILPETTEQFTPQMIDLQKYGGVSFTKGCYLGQEIIARTEHLGQLKRHLYQISSKENINPVVGEEITNEKHQKMGTVVAADENHIFAVIEDRAIELPLYLNELSIFTLPK